jgi:hypothetical protein
LAPPAAHAEGASGPDAIDRVGLRLKLRRVQGPAISTPAHTILGVGVFVLQTSLKTIPTDFRAKSLASFALRALRGRGRRAQNSIRGLAAVQGIKDGDTVDTGRCGYPVRGAFSYDRVDPVTPLGLERESRAGRQSLERLRDSAVGFCPLPALLGGSAR